MQVGQASETGGGGLGAVGSWETNTRKGLNATSMSDLLQRQRLLQRLCSCRGT